MTMVKITVSLPAELVAQAKRAVADGLASSVSAYVAEAIAAMADDDDALDRMIDEMLERTGGPATPEEIAWADKILGH